MMEAAFPLHDGEGDGFAQLKVFEIREMDSYSPDSESETKIND